VAAGEAVEGGWLSGELEERGTCVADGREEKVKMDLAMLRMRESSHRLRHQAPSRRFFFSLASILGVEGGVLAREPMDGQSLGPGT
jgi:hypothetical protein